MDQIGSQNLSMSSVLSELHTIAEKVEVGASVAKGIIEYLQKYGYLEVGGQLTISQVAGAIRMFHEYFALPSNGLITPQTLKAMSCSRCGVPDIIRERTEESRWRKTSLKFYIEKTVDGLTKEIATQAIYDAWEEWENITNIALTDIGSRNGADIIISIGMGGADNFDGPSGTLAWAYLPNGSDSQLLMRFDNAETWITDPTKRGILIKNVACHEFGHLLGLEHSKQQGALMAPYYNQSINKPQAVDDIPRIQALYGVKTTPAPTPTPTPTPTPSPSPSPPGPTDQLVLTVKGSNFTFDLPGYRITKIGK